MLLRMRTRKQQRRFKKQTTRRQRGGGTCSSKSAAIIAKPTWSRNTNKWAHPIPSSNLKTITIPAGILLYRSAKSGTNWNKLVPRYSYETEKSGVYFSTYIFQALAMAIEYSVLFKDVKMELGIYQTTIPLTLYLGKYTRELMPDGRVNKELSHFDSDMNPLADWKEITPILPNSNNAGTFVDYNFNKFKEYTTQKMREGKQYGEVLLASQPELDSLTLVNVYSFSADNLKKFILKYASENPESISIKPARANNTRTCVPKYRMHINIPPDNDDLFIRGVPLTEILTPAGGAGL